MIGRIAIAVLALLGPACASAACVVQQRAVVPLEITGTTIVAPVVVNGIAGHFILDTGASYTVVTPDAVAHFGLALDEWTATTMLGVGGVERRRNADPRSIALGGVALHRRSLAQDATLRVTTLPPFMAAGQPVDGLLGRDFLSLFDLDLNLPRRTLTVYEVHGCSGRFLPWNSPYQTIPVENPTDSALVVPVAMDDVPLRALLDSGASHSLVAAPGMFRLGLGIERLQDDPHRIVGGVGPHTVTMWQHKFHALQIGDETIAEPKILVAPMQLHPISDMLLGADWLLGHRVWISFATDQLFIAR